MENSKTQAAIFGEMVWLLSQSPLHKAVQVGTLEALIMPPIMHRQFRLFYDDQGVPVGFATWAMIDSDTITQIKLRKKNKAFPVVHAKEWKTGDTPYLIDFVCPASLSNAPLLKRLLDNLQQDIFKDHPINGVEIKESTKS